MGLVTSASDPRTSSREPHQLRIIDVLRERGTASRGEIGQATGLSRAAIASHVADLKSRGLILERGADDRGERRVGRGRPPTLLRLEPSVGAVVGVVFDHTSLRIGIADLSSSLVAERSTNLLVYTSQGDEVVSAGTALGRASTLVSELLADLGISRERVVGVGLGLPAPIDQRYGSVASETILHGWKDVQPAAELARSLKLPVELDNDANLGALGEFFFGAGRGMSDFIYVKQSPGVGSAVVIDGHLHRGALGVAGELGHIQINPDGPICDGCGKHGCLGPAVSTDAVLKLLRHSQGERLVMSDIPQLLLEGDLVATRVIGDAGRTLGRVLAGFCNLLNPEAVIIQGELSAPDGPLLAGVREALDRYALPVIAQAVRVEAGLLGSRAEMLGAVALVMGNTTSISSASFLGLVGSTAWSERQEGRRPHP
jgi:predicted NBD/HSP70 family sugar kinase